MDYVKFIKKFDSVLLATSCGDIPHCSYSTYIIKDNFFYIFISDIATHSDNLKSNPNLSLLFIDGEKDSTNIFARHRVSVSGISSMIEKHSQNYDDILDIFKQKFDSGMVDTLSSLDFNVYQIKPTKINTYFGFGEAKEITNISLTDIGE
jgi:putative heme iron utilization protein